MTRLIRSLLLLAALWAGTAQAASGITAGAIRWDAWYGTPDSSTIAAQGNLAPPAYQSRAPINCAPLTPPFSMTCSGTQSVMDAEITAAANNGVKYWAFLQYNSPAAFVNGWNLYQSSSLRANVNWCWIMTIPQFGSTGAFSTQMATLAAQMAQTNYQTVTATTTLRPVLYILWGAAALTNNFGGSNANFKAALDSLRSTVTGAGGGNPYIVLMGGGTPAAQATLMAAIGADAITGYISTFANTINGTFASLDTQTQATWAAMAASAATVPIAMTGWNQEPRIARPVPWNAGQKPYFGLNNRYAISTNAELATHLTAAVTYINANPTLVPSKLLLIYAWNECDEGGGCLVPTIGDPTGARLAAIKTAIQ